MLDVPAEDQGEAVGIDPPHESAHPNRRTLRRHQLELDRGPRLQPGIRSHLRAVRADVHRHREVTVRSELDEDRPGHAGAWLLSLVRSPRSRHKHLAHDTFVADRDHIEVSRRCHDVEMRRQTSDSMESYATLRCHTSRLYPYANGRTRYPRDKMT